MHNQKWAPLGPANAAETNIIIRMPNTNDSVIATLIFSSVAESVFGGTDRSVNIITPQTAIACRPAVRQTAL